MRDNSLLGVNMMNKKNDTKKNTELDQEIINKIKDNPDITDALESMERASNNSDKKIREIFENIPTYYHIE
ncbi:MAG: hypothetical protein AUJ85_01565 [Elusimicrobia bacterium CG1_02_37_114]|nr:MAG: hypothetical protein AUJ85_01565 [Elusimicrobia bacterium CG1_02_37_114]PIV52722.1 MAG: hypothetical protein COS17_07570 [Elusimicrobia bacterium CG02_land_8_20_14_3_00_37_13]PIZ13978.1 MAG: hypothetical protein COY53_01955 [Elusimicrobia bacterium CG_4_10_14_0_8_um_filter_37_32]